MATLEKLKGTISDIVSRRKNVTLSEIESVVSQLSQFGFVVRKPRKTTHGLLFGVNHERFSVCTHHPGSKQLKPRYVDEFANAMIKLGLYEE